MAQNRFTRPVALAIAAGVAFGGVQIAQPSIAAPQAQAGLLDNITSGIGNAIGRLTGDFKKNIGGVIDNFTGGIRIPGVNNKDIADKLKGLAFAGIDGGGKDVGDALNKFINDKANNFASTDVGKIAESFQKGDLSGAFDALRKGLNDNGSLSDTLLNSVLGTIGGDGLAGALGALGLGGAGLLDLLNGAKSKDIGNNVAAEEKDGAITADQLREALKKAGVPVEKISDEMMAKLAKTISENDLTPDELQKLIAAAIAAENPEEAPKPTSLEELLAALQNSQDTSKPSTSAKPKPSTSAKPAPKPKPKPSTSAKPAPKPSTGNTGGNTGGNGGNVVTNGNIDAETLKQILAALGIQSAGSTPTNPSLSDQTSSAALTGLAELIKGAKADLSNAGGDLKAANDKVAKFEEELARLKTAAAQQGQAGGAGSVGGPVMIQINQAQSGLADAVKEASSAAKKADEAQENVNKLQDEFNTAMKKLTEYQKKSDELKAELQATSKDNKAKIEELTTKLGATELAVTEVLGTATKNGEAIAKNAGLIDKNSKAIKATDKKVDEANKAISKNTEDIARNGKSLKDNLKSINKLQGDLGKTQQDVLGLQKETKAIAESLKATNKSLDATKKDLGNTKKDLDATKGKLDETIGTLDATIADLDETKQYLEDTINELNETKADLAESNGRHVDSIEFSEDGSLVLTRNNGEIVNIPAPAKKGLERCAGEIGEGILNLVPFVLNAGQAIAETRVPGMDEQLIAAQKQLGVFNPDIAAFAGQNPQLLGLGAAGLGILAVSLIPGTCGDASISQALHESFSQPRSEKVGENGEKESVLRGMADNFTGLFKELPTEEKRVPEVVVSAIETRPTPERVTIPKSTDTPADTAADAAAASTKKTRPAKTSAAKTSAAKTTAKTTAKTRPAKTTEPVAGK